MKTTVLLLLSALAASTTARADGEVDVAANQAEHTEVRHLSVAGGVVMGLSAPVLGTGAGELMSVLLGVAQNVGCGLGNFGNALGGAPKNTTPCPQPSNAAANASIALFSVGGAMLLTGSALLIVASVKKKRLRVRELQQAAPNAVGLAPLTTQGVTTGALASYVLRF